ncbi:MAG: hypothetical protein WCV56_03485 [Candidatus Omnitrophota bacterium]
MRKLILTLICLTAFLARYGTQDTRYAHAAVRLKIAVVNPSSDEGQTADVRYSLPGDIGPEEILRKGELEVGYDFDKNSYYLFGEVELGPGENRILDVEIADVWVIPGKEIVFLSGHTADLMEKLKGTRHRETGEALAKSIGERIDEVSGGQAKAELLGVREKMNIYYENVQKMNRIKDEIGMLENLVIDAGGVVAERVKIPETLTVSTGGEGRRSANLLDLNIRVRNPSEKSAQKTSLKYALPAEITPETVADAAGLEMGYDFENGNFYVFKKDILLEPSEAVTFTMKIRDIWGIPSEEVEVLRTHTGNMMLLLRDSPYEEKAKPLADRILSNTDGIIGSQETEADSDPKRRISLYRENLGVLNETKELVARLEKMVTQSGASPGVTVAKAERIEGGGPEVKRPRGYEGLSAIAKTIFRGKAPTPATTWKIIISIIVFLGIVGGLFFALWYGKAGK